MKKSASYGNWLRVVGLPFDVQEAVKALCSHGVDFNELMDLVSPKRRGRPRKRRNALVKPALPRGAPSLIPLNFQQLEEEIAYYKKEELASTDKGAIEALFSDIRSLQGETERAYAARQPTRGLQRLTHKRFIDSIMERLSRYRARERLRKSE